jgi:hypothetical protein
MTTTTTASSTDSTRVRSLAPAGLIGGIGGLAFVVSVIVQNGLRAGFPANDANAASIAAYYGGHRGTSMALAVLFPIGALGLVAFLGAMLARIGRGDHRAAAYGGAFGAAGIIGTYTMLIATDLAIAGYVHRGGAVLDVVSALWVLHNAIFGVLLVSIGVALAGLSAAAAASGQIAEWWKALGLLGAVLLLVAAATTPAIIDGSATMFIGLAGFVVWIVFVIVNSVALLRHN